MKLKVCGVNDAAFAVEAARLGADYLGFIFEPSSPRHVTVEQAAEIAAALGAEGESTVTDAGHILRGYESLEGALRSLGASVWREEG